MNSISQLTKTITAAAVAATLLSLAAGEAHAQWTLTPYVWTAALDARVSLNGTQVLNEHIAFSELLEDVDLAAMLRVERTFGSVGAMFDLFHIRMSTAGDAVRLPNGAAGTLDSEIGMTVFDATASYGLPGSARGVAVVAGTRLLVERTQVDLTIPTSPTSTITQRTSDRDWQPNAIVGLQVRRRLASRLSLDAKGDIGTGSTKLTWSAGSQMVYAIDAHERFALSAGYRRLTVKYHEEGQVQADLTMAGFITGFRVAF